MIGLDVSDRSIKVVELSDDDNPTLRTVCWSPLSPNLMRRGVIQDPQAIAVEITAALTRCTPVSVRGKMVVASIPEPQSFVRPIKMPGMSDIETDEAVKWAVRQHIPFDLERVYLDWQPVFNGQEQRREVLVGAARRDVVDPLLDVLDAVGLQVVALELETQALVRSLLPLDPAGITGVLLIDMGATATNIIYFDQGGMRFTTSIARGGDDLTMRLAQELSLRPTQAAEQKAVVGADSVGSPTATAIQDLTRELVSSIKVAIAEPVVASGSNSGIRAILLSGGTANLPGIVSIFNEAFPAVPVQVGNPLINLSRGEEKDFPLSLADAAHFTTAIGLALRRNNS